MKTFAHHFIPRYDELTLFVMSLTCVLIFFANIDVLKDADFSLSKINEQSVIPIVIFTGLVLSIYHIFSRKIKTPLERLLMLFFAVFVNAISGIAAGSHALQYSQGYMAIFPVLNIINGAVLVILLRANILDENSIIETDLPSRFVWLSSGMAVLLFVTCQYVFKLYWASTFSICVAHATNLNGPVIKLFQRKGMGCS
ncbi:MAG TPA: hypothetical protein DCP92_16280 [Nitrospiraceae bacterium]|jgi:hypothetical protein|nr:hypothetical protein [Nitrospiraceae bacterium]